MNGNQESKASHDQNKQEESMSQRTNVVLTGFVGGILWSAIGQLAYFFNFTKIGPQAIISGWMSDRWSDGFLGIVISILLFGLLSILIALLYYVILRKVQYITASILYGAILWAIVHFVIANIWPKLVLINELDLNTITTTLCLYVLYGLFIGVSISFDETERQREKEKSRSPQEAQSS